MHDLVIDAIIEELRAGNKKNHYYWWIFPTDKPGDNDPLKTKVLNTTYKDFLYTIKYFDKWLTVINLIVKNPKKLPQIDLKKMHFFKDWWAPRLLTEIEDHKREFINTKSIIEDIFRNSSVKDSGYETNKQKLLESYRMHKKLTILRDLILQLP